MPSVPFAFYAIIAALEKIQQANPMEESACRKTIQMCTIVFNLMATMLLIALQVTCLLTDLTVRSFPLVSLLLSLFELPLQSRLRLGTDADSLHCFLGQPLGTFRVDVLNQPRLLACCLLKGKQLPVSIN